MRLHRDRHMAALAAANVVLRKRQYQEHAGWLHQFALRHRSTLLVGGGFLAGTLFGQARLGNAARKLGAAASVASVVLRSALGPLLLASVLGRGARVKPADSPTQG